MKRRGFIVYLCIAASLPFKVEAQSNTPTIGYLSSGVQKSSVERLRMFQEGLNQAGYDERKNIIIEYRFADGEYDRLPELASDLVARNVQVIAALDLVTTVAAKKATTKIPIVFGMGVDPVKAGLVNSLSHPGGNLTGTVRLNAELESKRLEIIHELVPKGNIFALLVNSDNPNAESSAKDTAEAARLLDVDFHVFRARNDQDLDAVFSELETLHVAGLVIAPDPYFLVKTTRLAELAFIHRIPTIYQYRQFAEAGGLISYSGDPTEGYRLIGLYIARILKGEKAADLPVQQYSKLEMIINLRTARALGINVPISILVRADEIIE